MTTTADSVAPDQDPSIHPEAHRSARWAQGISPAALTARASALLRQSLWDIWVNNVAASGLWPGRVRRWMLCRAGMDIRTNGISAHCRFTNADVSIGRYSYLNEGFYGDARGGIRIGDRVAIGPRVMIVSSTHIVGSREQRCGAHQARRVTIGDGSAIGAGAAVHAGVKVAPGVMIAAGSVVLNSIRANSLVAGVPAKIVSTYDN